MNNAPERIWIAKGCIEIDDPEIPGSSATIYDADFEPHESKTEYTRADLPPTIKQALTVPEVRELVEALAKIAAFTDTLASDCLARTGSYAAFDEPGAVEIARAALHRIGETK